MYYIVSLTFAQIKQEISKHYVSFTAKMDLLRFNIKEVICTAFL